MTTYSISDLALEFDITTRTLRFYEEKGLLTPTRKGQARIYSLADRVALKLILRGKRLGFTLEESFDIIKMYDPSHGNQSQLQTLINKVREKRSQLEQQQHDIEVMLFDLKESEDKCLEAMSRTKKSSKKTSTVKIERK